MLAPAWPGLEGDVEALRRDPSPIAGLSAAKVLAHYEVLIRGLQRPPILMGHSFGGTFTHILIDRGLGAAGVSIDGASVRGIADLPLSTLRSTAHVLSNPRNRGKAVPLNEKRFRYAFGNTLDEAAEAMELPFAGVHQLCAPMLGRLDALPAPQRDAASVALGLASGQVPDRFLVGLAVLGLVSAEAEERPLLCLVEDAQWLDAASSQILGFVARRVLAESVAIVIAVRDPITGRDFDGLPEWRSKGCARTTHVPSWRVPSRAGSTPASATAWSPRRAGTRSPSWSCPGT